MVSPQGALALPPRPSVERYRKLAKELVKACKSGDEDAVGRWAERWVETLAGLGDLKRASKGLAEINRSILDIEDFAREKMLGPGATGANCTLASAQFVIARSHGFESWPKFVKHIEALGRKGSSVARFEAAADAIVGGKTEILNRLLKEDPGLIRARSTREHQATLLHYVSANGVEGYRQKTPKNIVRITKLLLNAGAEIDAAANVYGGGATALGLAGTSVHPEKAGVQEALLQALLDHGARIDLPRGGGNDDPAVLGCLANGRGEAAAFLADRGAELTLASAAGVGRLDVVKGYFDDGGALKGGTSKEQMEAGFLYACGYGQTEVVEFLLERGVDLASHSGDGQTGLHWAVIGGRLDTVKSLLRRNPPLEVKNVYGGTVLGQALWTAAHGGDSEAYIKIIETLIAAGAEIPRRHVPVNKRVDDWLEKHGSQAEPTWYWYGEKPRDLKR
ncbi:MAG: Ankyrin [Edaphobacter sp.]|nr:Ankyrin [Edaphobacter sp.]